MHAQWVLRNASSQWTFKHRSSLLALPTSMGKQHSYMTCVHQVFLFTNAIFFSAVLPPTKELRFHEMGGSPSYWSISNLHRLPRGRHRQAEAGAREGTGSCRSLVSFPSSMVFKTNTGCVDEWCCPCHEEKKKTPPATPHAFPALWWFYVLRTVLVLVD